jgi:hypothetical protein
MLMTLVLNRNQVLRCKDIYTQDLQSEKSKITLFTEYKKIAILILMTIIK